MSKKTRSTLILILVVLAALLLLVADRAAAQKYEGLAGTPPMGWNSWNNFACDVDEELIRETADAMVASGMKDAGYTYVNIDDCWHGERDSLGFIHPDPDRFPSGMKALADYVHAKGLKLGIYSDAGWQTCGGRPGSRGREFQDAQTYAEWGIDYLKYDWCNTEGLNAEGAYMTMGRALLAAGRPIVLSICEWGTDRPWEWGPAVGHLWRTTGDITNCFDCVVDHGSWNSWGILQILDMQGEDLRNHAGPGHWNDPDMMEVGNDLTDAENRAHFGMWAMLAAPLIAGNDIRHMTESTRLVLTDADVVAIDQDPLGIQGFLHAKWDNVESWYRPLAEGDWAVAVLNRGIVPHDVSIEWAEQDANDELSGRSTGFGETTYHIRDLYADEDLGDTGQVLNTTVPGHDILLLRLTPEP